MSSDSAMVLAFDGRQPLGEPLAGLPQQLERVGRVAVPVRVLQIGPVLLYEMGLQGRADLVGRFQRLVNGLRLSGVVNHRSSIPRGQPRRRANRNLISAMLAIWLVSLVKHVEPGRQQAGRLAGTQAPFGAQTGRARRAAAVNACQPSAPPAVTARAAVPNTARSQ